MSCVKQSYINNCYNIDSFVYTTMSCMDNGFIWISLDQGFN